MQLFQKVLQHRGQGSKFYNIYHYKYFKLQGAGEWIWDSLQYDIVVQLLSGRIDRNCPNSIISKIEIVPITSYQR